MVFTFKLERPDGTPAEPAVDAEHGHKLANRGHDPARALGVRPPPGPYSKALLGLDEVGLVDSFAPGHLPDVGLDLLLELTEPAT